MKPDYWARQAVEWEAAKKLARHPGGLVFASLPVPALRGRLRVVVAPKWGGYRWFVSDSTQLSSPERMNVYARGWALWYGRAISEGEVAAMVAS